MDAAHEQPPTPPTDTKKCNKPWCKIWIPINSRYGGCDNCRALHRANQKKYKQNLRATASDSTPISGKRKRTSIDSTNDRPPARPRSDQSHEDGIQPTPDADEEHSDDGRPWDDEDKDDTSESFSDAESFCDALRAEFKGGKAIDFHGTYPVQADPLVSPKERVQMVAAEIWKLSGYRFTVKDHRELKSGHRARFWCSQDEAHKKKSKASDDPDIRNRDTVGMKRYPCGSKMTISCRTIAVQLHHAIKHTAYVDVAMPAAAFDMIRENVEWSTPVEMVGKVQAVCPDVSAQQIHRAWAELSEVHWRREDAQLLSAEKLLHEYSDDVDIFQPEAVPEGVEMLCWGMKKIAEPLRGKDGAGFPLSYLLLSTASSIDQGKRRKALTAWAKCVRDTYGIDAKFTHVDKDMAEIGMLKDVWDAKISLCWWHLRRAVRTRLGIGKLSTTPYDPNRARAEFSFIDPAFVPQGQADAGEYEGGIPDIITPVVSASQQPYTMVTSKGLRITIRPQPLTPAPVDGVAGAASRSSASVASKSEHLRENVEDAAGRESEDLMGEADESESEPEEEQEEIPRRTFCPADSRDPILSMMEKHFCAHPLLPGYAHPSPEGIKRWAVLQMYKFCVEHGLPEVWAYLWENWYRRSRWELWARCAHPEIPVLKTTMILESHWRRIKHDFLHHFHMPRCDLLVWILVTKLAPCYYRKLDRLLTDTGRYRELPSWRKDFKRTWRKLEKTPITLPVNPAYKTDAKKMLCTCPSLAPSRFLICKHIVQSMKRVPPVFFLEVKRQRTAPFWVHPTLQPASETDNADTPSGDLNDASPGAVTPGTVSDGEDDDDDDVVDTHQPEEVQPTFLESMDENIATILEFAKGLEFQRMLQALEREGASFLRLAKACLAKEKRLRSTRGTTASTWDKSTSSAMFYRARPAPSDANT
ncbi:hypothetical protein DFH07DRAFT_988137 [Mycena maculata]|uniref:SWIM-type domain-containing protein n=1 Tax=Mycena maculata TaxID=230809 RepID=A0AAD7JY12_9AGAR|nr:hypothetical protein DFH07DRAFT_988137 [Mycena maculata]